MSGGQIDVGDGRTVVRFAVATPLSFLHPRLRRLVIERASSLTINPAFVRRLPAGRERVVWIVLEIACCAWAVWRVWRREHRYG